MMYGRLVAIHAAQRISKVMFHGKGAMLYSPPQL